MTFGESSTTCSFLKEAAKKVRREGGGRAEHGAVQARLVVLLPQTICS
jgi:hypothetical protein